ncbi:polar amino acid transport system substrate-binding protein [Actinopolyspora alba]|uniref:Polar amino acid transport system substrate-binding protein n=1 Tax=Actinopolyspora alba TaxID=673379 RepID=A0A1I2AUS4_9ACTN|nr:transporter substrate-binding domain-containing protein [Actinopolyspora alba]SFE47328.1 polar amino acid transport system substrate-binding protein [Actinopolyspora alba]
MALRTTLRAAALLPAFALVAAVAGCGGGGGGEAKGVPLVNEGQLTTCTNLPYEPFESRKDGEVVGFDIDLIDLVAKDLGVEQQVTNIPFTTLQSGQALNVGNCDVAAAAITITDVRKKNFDFSDPYFDATQALLAPKGSGLDSFEKLRGKTLGYQKGTTGAKYAKERAEQHGVTLKQFADLGLLLQNMRIGKVDAAINDDFALIDFADQNQKFEVTKKLETDESYGFGVKTGNSELQSKINEVLAEAKQDGTYDRLYEKWFGHAPSEK